MSKTKDRQNQDENLCLKYRELKTFRVHCLGYIIIEKFVFYKFTSLGVAFAAFGMCFEVMSNIGDNIGWDGSKERLVIITLVSLLIAMSFFYVLLIKRLKIKFRIVPCADNSTSNDENNRQLKIIGVVAPISSWSTTFYIDIIRGIQEAANRERVEYQKRIVIIDVPREEGIQSTEELILRMVTQIDALIVINIKLSLEVCNKLIEENVPVVNMHHNQRGYNGKDEPFISSLLPDHKAFKELLDHLLIEKECKTAVLITKALKNPFKNARVDPFRKEKRDIFISSAKKRNMKINKPIELTEFDGKLNEGEAYILEVNKYLYCYGKQLFEKIKNSTLRGVAFIFLADDVAVSFLKACIVDGRTAQQRGYRVSGFDNNMGAELMDLTSIDYSLSSLGHNAYAKIEHALEYPDPTLYTSEKIATVLHIRDTTNW